MSNLGIASVALLCALGVVGCSDASAQVTVTNQTRQTIRTTGNCVEDDPHTLQAGQTDNQYYLGAQCRIDNGDGLHGMLACITLRTSHTVITNADLHNPPGPNDCWGSGTHH